MFVPIANTPRNYAWGSATDIAALLGVAPSGQPEAELWLGAHPGSPARIVTPGAVGGFETLADWVEHDPASAGLAEPRLPFLLKLLAANAPLSLQAHPSAAQAADGFARENAAGLAQNDPIRNYKDAFHKPELIFALSERFEALCGFRPVADAAADVDALLAVPGLSAETRAALSSFRSSLNGPDSEVLRRVVGSLLGEDVSVLVAAVTDAAASAPLTPAVDTVRMLADHYPGDPGIVVSLLVHRVTLRRGEVLYLPAGNIHAYLRGFGVELMAASDNVLRGGLTPKHIDVAELLSVLDFTPLPVPYLRPERAADGVELYRPGVPDFELSHVVASGDGLPTVDLPGVAIAIATAGDLTLAGASGTIDLRQGDAVYITADEGSIAVRGTGELFVASTRL
ncbi:mannose-6-phosphate isomerase, class I [Mycetocola miduiensis]|uniref:mannose-6-phosphate isomerase n=1 Tax=Mycetocola miduiensis TaxID=995034 RepID=A0A1I5E0E7_9MICO|nr:mannose-6-phosphate isomerase, class I [Mycetocola miduiensis]SFO04932.1 mannose-6-phosphate isomerase, type 1 [Mycetocola miduiensis]